MKKILSYCLLASTVVGFAACGNANKSGGSSTDSTGSSVSASASTLNQLTNDPKGSPLHFYFNMNEVGQTDSSVVYDAKSLYNNDTVGFKLEVLKNIEIGRASCRERVEVWEGVVHWNRRGQQVTRLVR